MIDNLFSSPKSVSIPELPLAREEPQSFGQIARLTFLAWEKLRLVYIGILSFLVGICWLSVHFSSGASPLKFRIGSNVIIGAVIANLCYFAGPCLETYVSWLGWKSKTFRIFLFVTGTLFASFLAFASLLSIPGPDF